MKMMRNVRRTVAAASVEHVQPVPPPPAVPGFGMFQRPAMRKAPPIEVSYSEFLKEVKSPRGDVKRVDITQDGSELRAYTSDPEFPAMQVFLPENDTTTVPALLKSKIMVRVRPAQPAPWFDVQNLIMYFFEFTLLFAVFRMFLNAVTGGAGGMGGNPLRNMIDSSAKLDESPNTGVTFEDVAGCDNAKRDLMETVDFLKNPGKYTAIGAKMPKGILMVGPPGTGKTRLARAVAGEAGVPFFSCSGSEFIEMFVGVGSARVRSLFRRAQEKAPCIVFIDEIDAIGKKRGGGVFGGGGHEEHDQTINQLLTMMDGFTPSTGVVVIAATNRPEILDDALLRPGRFDRRVHVELPDVAGREAILRIHSRNKTLTADVDLHKIAKVTVGFSGADLENLCNEACIYAARASRTRVSPADFDQALEKLTIGEERSTTLFTEEQRELIAYHEAGHALLGMALANFDRIRKVSIVPRGPTGGITYFEPRNENGLASREYFENQIMVALGGRIAEELVYGANDVTNGASGDLARVTDIARDMVSEFGFSAGLAPMNLADMEGLAAEVDTEINNIVCELYAKATDLMEHHLATLHALAAELLEKETLGDEDLEKYAEQFHKK